MFKPRQLKKMVLSVLIFASLLSEIISTTIINQPGPEEPSCICHHGYSVQKHSKDKKLYCRGILHEGRTACVNLERPTCKCTLIKGFIIQDLYGYWCVKVKPGFVEEIRWECENAKQWNRFFEIFPEEKPVSGSQL